MEKILVIGASGFIGQHIARTLLADGMPVRCLVRNPARAQDLATAGCEVVQGDISDPVTMQHALDGVRAVYIAVHTISPQQSSAVGQGFMDIEMSGVQNIVTVCQMHGVRRLIYITSLGMSEHASNAWLQGRWRIEQFLLQSGLDVTIIRPGQVIGRGGFGFNTVLSQAKRHVTITIGNGRQQWQNIALDDLIYYLVGVLNIPSTYGQCYDVGDDTIMTTNQMIDIIADVLGRPHPLKIPIPQNLLAVVAPLIERVSKFPSGSIKSFADGVTTDLIGDPMPIRAILPRPPLPYRQAVERELQRNA